MTDRIDTLTVVLEEPIREDDVEVLCAAIRQMRWVRSVEKNVANMVAGHAAVENEKQRIYAGMMNLIYPPPRRGGDGQ